MKKRFKRWFSARCIFLRGDRNTYEERIIVLAATSFDDAVKRGEHEALEYAGFFDDCIYTGLIQVYKIEGRKLRTGTEIFSLLRDSDLSVDSYLNRYFDSGGERQQYM